MIHADGEQSTRGTGPRMCIKVSYFCAKRGTARMTPESGKRDIVAREVGGTARLLGSSHMLRETYSHAKKQALSASQVIGEFPSDVSELDVASHQSSSVEENGRGYVRALMQQSRASPQSLSVTLTNLAKDWEKPGSSIYGHQQLGIFGGINHSSHVRMIKNWELRHDKDRQALFERYPALSYFEEDTRDAFRARTGGEECIIRSVNVFIQSNFSSAGQYKFHIDGHHAGLLLTDVFYLGEISGIGGDPCNCRRGEAPFAFYQYGMASTLNFTHPGQYVVFDARSYHCSVTPGYFASYDLKALQRLHKEEETTMGDTPAASDTADENEMINRQWYDPEDKKTFAVRKFETVMYEGTLYRAAFYSTVGETNSRLEWSKKSEVVEWLDTLPEHGPQNTQADATDRDGGD